MMMTGIRYNLLAFDQKKRARTVGPETVLYVTPHSESDTGRVEIIESITDLNRQHCI